MENYEKRHRMQINLNVMLEIYAYFCTLSSMMQNLFIAILRLYFAPEFVANNSNKEFIYSHIILISASNKLLVVIYVNIDTKKVSQKSVAVFRFFRDYYT